MSSIRSLIDFARSDLVKLFRYVAVSLITVPIGIALLWIFLRRGMNPIVANILSFTLSTIPNYLLNRYWVWSKRSANSIKGEIMPFCLIALLGATLSTGLVAIATLFTDENLIFLALNFCAFGVVWVLKFFVLEKYLFGPGDEAGAPSLLEETA